MSQPNVRDKIVGESINCLLYEVEAILEDELYLVCSNMQGRFIVKSNGYRCWEALSKIGEFPGGNTQDAREQAIVQAQTWKNK